MALGVNSTNIVPLKAMEAIFIVFFSEWLKMEYYGRSLEQAVDIAAPL
jgi:hypothetical protein